MPVYKDEKTNSWYVKRRYKDWTGKDKHLMKRGFKLKQEAAEWENNFLQRQSHTLDMTFGNYYEVYKSDISARIKESTLETKTSIIEHQVLPYFRDLPLREITSAHVLRWQNTIMQKRTSEGKPFSATYLKTIHNQLTAMFNHAVRHYSLSQNPARIAGAIGDKEGSEMQIWTVDEYKQFSAAISNKPISFICFEILYWCGIREGELLALTSADFDFKKKELSVTKTYHRAHGEDIITSPKTKQSIRKVSMPDFICTEVQKYMDTVYKLHPEERLFPITKSYLLHEMDRGSDAAGVKHIRVHDIRHSHVSLYRH